MAAVFTLLMAINLWSTSRKNFSSIVNLNLVRLKFVDDKFANESNHAAIHDLFQ